MFGYPSQRAAGNRNRLLVTWRLLWPSSIMLSKYTRILLLFLCLRAYLAPFCAMPDLLRTGDVCAVNSFVASSEKGHVNRIIITRIGLPKAKNKKNRLIPSSVVSQKLPLGKNRVRNDSENYFFLTRPFLKLDNFFCVRGVVKTSYVFCANRNCQITTSKHINTRGWIRFLSRHPYVWASLDIYSNYYSSSPSCYVPNEFFMHTSRRASVISLWVCSTPTEMNLFMWIFFLTRLPTAWCHQTVMYT